jgi:hypothetical protein
MAKASATGKFIIGSNSLDLEDEHESRRERRLSLFARGSAYCSFEYSALAYLRMGMSGPASFQRAKKSLHGQASVLKHRVHWSGMR